MRTLTIRRAVLPAAACILALAGCGKTATVASNTSSTPTPSGTASAGATATATTLPPAPSPSPSPRVTASPARTPTPAGTPTHLATPTPSPTINPAAAGTVFTDANNGQTVHVAVGQQFSVSLGSTYWTFEALSDASVLHVVGTPATTRSPGCIPGGGCGTVTAVFTAVAPGQVTVKADRRSCGEAMLCTGAAGMFALTVAVP